jgi:hypothetical protein
MSPRFRDVGRGVKFEVHIGFLVIGCLFAERHSTFEGLTGMLVRAGESCREVCLPKNQPTE